MMKQDQKRLILADNLTDALNQVIIPLLKDWSNPWSEPIWLIAPSQGMLDIVKAHLIEKGPFFGIHFLTPTSVRNRLAPLAGLQQPAGLLERRLALTHALTNFAPDIAATIRGQIDTYERFLERFLTSNLPWDALPESWMPVVFQTTLQTLRQSGQDYPPCTDRQLAKWVKTNPSCLAARCILIGFDGQHLSLMPLLKMVIEGSPAAILVADLWPEIEEDFIATATWEAFFGSSTHCMPVNQPTNLTIWISQHPQESLAATLDQIQILLTQTQYKRIVVACDDDIWLQTLSHTLTHELIPHWHQEGLYQQRANPSWVAWLTYQQTRQLEDWITAMRNRYTDTDLHACLALEKKIKQAVDTLQTTNIELIIAYLKENGSIINELDIWALLPDQLTATAFAQAAHLFCQQMNVQIDLSFLERWKAQSIMLKYDQWCTYALAYGYKKYRHPYANHLFSRIWLAPLRYAKAIPADTSIILCSEQHASTDIFSIHDELLQSTHEPALTIGPQGLGQDILKDDAGWATTQHIEKKYRSRTVAHFKQQASPIKRSISRPPKTLQHYPQLQAAYQARRAIDQPYGPYEYQFNQPQHIDLSCKQWELCLQQPTSIWYECILKTKPLWDPTQPPHADLQKGTWVHDWIQVQKGLHLDIKDWKQMIEHRCATIFSSIHQLYKKLELPIPAFFQMLGIDALATTLRYAEQLHAYRHHIQTIHEEWTIPPGCRWTIGDCSILLKGRADVVLETVDGGCWIIDFKTGHQKNLTLTQLQQGYGLQLALYALSWYQTHKSKPSISILSTAIEELKPQLTWEDLMQADDLWQKLARIQTTGIFGEKPTLYGRNQQRPLATLPIPDAILKRKWMHLHPQLDIEH